MITFGEQYLLQAIHSEIIARDLYAKLSDRVKSEKGKAVMNAMAKEEDKHHTILAERYKSLSGKEYIYDPNIKAGPDYSFLEESVFGYTQVMEALKLALGVELDSVRFYSKLVKTTSDPKDKKTLKKLVKFEESHKKILKHEIKTLEKTNHWNLK